MDFNETCSGLNVHFFKATIEDTFAFLLDSFASGKTGAEAIEIDEDEYQIQYSCSNEDCKTTMNFFLYKAENDTCAIELKKVTGSRDHFQ